jgi:hypothetical protein
LFFIYFVFVVLLLFVSQKNQKQKTRALLAQPSFGVGADAPVADYSAHIMYLSRLAHHFGFGLLPHLPYEFIGFGAMDVTKPYEFTGFGDIHGPKPCKFMPYVARQYFRAGNRASGPDVGRVLSGDPENRPSGRPKAGRRADVEVSLSRIRPKSSLRNIE